MPTWYAKSGNQGGWWEPLRNHLSNVADQASSNGAAFGAGELGRIAGLCHDLAKYSPRFLARLRGETSGLDHWTMGAAAVLQTYKMSGLPAACAVLGHHVGLTCGNISFVQAISKAVTDPARFPNLTERDVDVLLQRFTEDGLQLPSNIGLADFAAESVPVSRMLDFRMLFSALVDADAHWSEAHRHGDSTVHYRPRPDGPQLDPLAALRLLDHHLAAVRSSSPAAKHINSLRDRLLQYSLASGDWDRGLFTLAAPTGAGKTWAMMAFALRHAARHNLRRIVVVIPYLSIIEQTAGQYGDLFSPVFGDSFLIEDHSLSGRVGKQDDLHTVRDDQAQSAQVSRLLAENWDAPVIVTTSVQFLESLFANKPSACRKLHNLANSVILFDEVQTLPLELSVFALAAMSRLVERYACSVVFSTATQPAFDHLHSAVAKQCLAGWQPRHIADAGLFETIRQEVRQHVEWRLSDRCDWETLCTELTRPKNRHVLCIVNLKAHAKALLETLAEIGTPGLMHLSTNMCQAHRRRVLDEVRRRLKAGPDEPCRLISTQCVEVGVDLDFPVVFRSLGPLEAIAQAAGRCNRHGCLPEPGRLVVFVPQEEKYPTADYARAANLTRMFIKALKQQDRQVVLDSPALLARYYRDLYTLSEAGTRETGHAGELAQAIRELDFVKTAELFRLIRTPAINVLVPYDRDVFEELMNRYQHEGRLTREWVADARPHTISIIPPKPGDAGVTWLQPMSFHRSELADAATADWFYLSEEQPGDIYDPELLGLKKLRDCWIP